jgi:CRISPR-associated endonuclease/helicase Cas3
LLVRRKDIIELFDTTPDLAGRDIDISRFVRDTADSDVHVFWRDVGKEGPAEDALPPARDEQCPAPIGDVRELVAEGDLAAWTRDELEDRWVHVTRATPIHPGSVLMVAANEGRYIPKEGWAIRSKDPVPPIGPLISKINEGYGSDRIARSDWKTIGEHTDEVVAMAASLAGALGLPAELRSTFLEAVRWHDAGKAHGAFQACIVPEAVRPRAAELWAKAPEGAWRVGRPPIKSKEGDARRRYFRHELASGLLALQNGKDDLVSYLAACHHGKVRQSIRSMPDETHPPKIGTRFARGVWDGDPIPAMDLGGGVKVAPSTIDLSVMEMGDGPNGASWLARMLALRDRPDLGPLRLAYFEALMKVSDERASGGIK